MLDLSTHVSFTQQCAPFLTKKHNFPSNCYSFAFRWSWSWCSWQSFMLLSLQQLPSQSSLQCWGARRRKRRRRRRRGAPTQDIQAIGEVTIRDRDTTAAVTEDDYKLYRRSYSQWPQHSSRCFFNGLFNQHQEWALLEQVKYSHCLLISMLWEQRGVKAMNKMCSGHQL